MRGFFGRRAVRVVVIIALVVVFLFLVLNWYVAPTKPGERKDLVLAVAQILGGTALLLGLYFTWRTLQVNREGQITERFTRAIDQLGKVEGGQKQYEIRIGGIYALERIARESEEDYWPIMEILTAYVRQHARGIEEQRKTTESTAVAMKPLVDRMGTTGVDWTGVRWDGWYRSTQIPSLSPDIGAIMGVLRRLTRSWSPDAPKPLDLRHTNLAGANFSKANFSTADFMGANLAGAAFHAADLSLADLREADLTMVDFEEAELVNAIFAEAQLWGANLTQANLTNAYLGGADLTEATFRGTNLTSANLEGANLTEALLWDAQLSGANLDGANLTGAYLTMTYAAIGTRVDAQVTQDQIKDTLGDKNTRLPPHLEPPAHWGLKTDEQPEGD